MTRSPRASPVPLGGLAETAATSVLRVLVHRVCSLLGPGGALIAVEQGAEGDVPAPRCV